MKHDGPRARRAIVGCAFSGFDYPLIEHWLERQLAISRL